MQPLTRCRSDPENHTEVLVVCKNCMSKESISIDSTPMYLVEIN